MKYDPPVAPYVQAKHQGGKQKPTAILLRPSFTNSEDGAALAVAQYWHKASSFWDAGHYTVDNSKRFRCVRDNVIAGQRETADKNAIRVVLCADPAYNDVFWDEQEHGLVLKNTAKLVAELCLAYNIRPRYLDDDAFTKWERRRSRGRGGIRLFEKSGWPSENFLKEVNAQLSLKTWI